MPTRKVGKPPAPAPGDGGPPGDGGLDEASAYKLFVSAGDDELTPAMLQLREVKRQYPPPEYLVLFQMGDFWETFFDDAFRLSAALDCVRTVRGTLRDKPVPLAGIPLKSLGYYLRTLLFKGFKVVIVEQVQDPREAKGVVLREVTRVVTPGTITDEDMLDSRRENLCLAVSGSKAPFGLAWAELSTGRFEVAEVDTEETLAAEVARLEPAEILWPDGELHAEAPPAVLTRLRATELPRAPVYTGVPAAAFDHREGKRKLKAHLGVKSLRGYDIEDLRAGLAAASGLYQFLKDTQKSALDQITAVHRTMPGQRMLLDAATRRCLELTESQREGHREGTVLDVIDRTATPMGGRLLRAWLTSPLTDRGAVEARHAVVQFLLEHPSLRREVAPLLTGIGDLERLAARVATRRANARDLVMLRQGLSRIPGLQMAITEAARAASQMGDGLPSMLALLAESLDALPVLCAQLERAVVADPPGTIKEGGIIRDGYDKDLDEYRAITREGEAWLVNYQAREIKRTKIGSLKVKYNSVHGYFIEVTNTHKEKVPADYQRRQTMKNAERYITAELQEYENRVTVAEERAQALEYDLFVALRDEARAAVGTIQQTAGALASLDVLLAFADQAERRNYVRPQMRDDRHLTLDACRHPVLEETTPTFVPNDCTLLEERPHWVITGPNMSGKSTFIRQVALAVILAQTGSFVPARSASVGMCDRVFTRVGSGDEIARGQSTFMVEMTETANILNHATPQSLVILDEVGRGTSTFDGVSIAWAAMEHLAERVGCRTLFATHYHELTELSALYPSVANMHVAVHEWEGEVVFLHSLAEGPTDRSYGIHVARIAGLPPSVVERARQILFELERNAVSPTGRPTFVPKDVKAAAERPRVVQRTLFVPAKDPIYEQLQKLDPFNLTPLDALRILSELKGMADDVPET